MNSMKPRRLLNILRLLPACFLATHCAFAQETPEYARQTEAEIALQSRQSEFPREIIRVARDVYTAVGYSPANVSMVVGTDGVIIIDTAMSAPHAEEILTAFREISSLPVKCIIYTHAHGDHTGGASTFIGNDQPEIWARDNFGSEDSPLMAAGLAYQQQRGVRQAGFALPDDLRINNGIAPAMRPNRPDAFANAAGENSSQGDLPSTSPNHTFSSERINIEIAGVTLELVAAPGETEDQLYVWYPAKEIVFAGDNYYRSFPNLYAIRGTPYRDVLAWSESLDKMLAEIPAAVVPGHTLPAIGRREALAALENHRDAIRFVHDKTVEGMNMGLTPDELVGYVQLPEELASNPDLGEYYGRVSWAVRSIFNGYLGWYDGNPSNLSPLSAAEEAQRIADLAGDVDALFNRAQQALAMNEAQWAAQLCDYLLALDSDDSAVKRLKADALTMLARDSLNALGRNYYLTVAQQLRMEAGED